MTENIKNTKLLLLDLDGTVYVDNSLIGDVKNTLQYMRDKGIIIGYVSNNSSKSPKEYIKKHKKLKIHNEKDIYYSSLDASIDLIKEKYADKTVYAVASDKVKKTLKKQGIKLGDDADVVLLTFDRTLTYDKLAKANLLLNKGATYIATHSDFICPAKGSFVPDLGSILKLLEASSNRWPDVIIGKPFTVMADFMLAKLNVKREEVTMVGDRLSTDIQFGINAGFNTVTVLTGDTDIDKAKTSPIKADLTLEDINVLKEYI